MTHTFKSLALALVGAAFFVGSIAPAGAATNQAVLTVNASVTNNCDVLTQPAALTMYWDTLTQVGIPGTSSYTYACTNGASVSVIPTGVGEGGAYWGLFNLNGNPFDYYLYNDLACSANQLTSGTSESLANGTGSSQTYNICAAPTSNNMNPQPPYTYTGTVTFTFNFGP